MSTSAPRIDQFLKIHAGRADAWRELTHLAKSWARGAANRVEAEAALAALAPTEAYHAYPGAGLLAMLTERIASDDAGSAARLARRISNALLTRSYRDRPGDWDLHDERAGSDLADIMPPALDENGGTFRPYFEVLYVSSQPAARWPALAAEMRRLRRPEDSFVYEPVFVGSFEDAVCAAMVNPSHRLRRAGRGLALSLAARCAGAARGARSARRAGDDRRLRRSASPALMKRIRPELDVYPAVRPRRGAAGRRSRGRLRPPDLLRGRGAAGTAPRDPGRRARRATRRPSSTI